MDEKRIFRAKSSTKEKTRREINSNFPQQRAEEE